MYIDTLENSINVFGNFANKVSNSKIKVKSLKKIVSTQDINKIHNIHFAYHDMLEKKLTNYKLGVNCNVRSSR